MKILMISPTFYPVIGGTENVIKNLTKVLVNKGMYVDILTFNKDKSGKCLWRIESKKMGITTLIKLPCCKLFGEKLNVFNPFSIIFNAHYITKPCFLKILVDYDILHFHDDVDLTFPLFAYSIRKPKILHCHTIANTREYYMKIPTRKYILKKVAQIYLSYSISDIKSLIKLGIPEDRIRYLPNGVDTEKFKPSRNDKSDNVILYVGRLVEWKGLHILIKSLSYIKKSVKLVIIGPNYNDDYFKKVSVLMNEKAGKIHKIMYLGPVSEQSLIKWYQKASILVSPLLPPVLSFPTVALEALSCETPVVASKLSKLNEKSMPAYVQNYKNGILVKPNDPVALANAIQYLLENPDLRKRLGRNGRKHVIKYFSWDAVSNRLTKIYNELLNTS